jgi:hypothetical protein
MSNLTIPTSGLALSRVERRVAKEIAIARATSFVAAARAEAKIDAIGSVTEAAVISSARVAMVEAMATAQTPHAAGRYRFIADSGAASMGAVIHRMARGL